MKDSKSSLCKSMIDVAGGMGNCKSKWDGLTKQSLCDWCFSAFSHKKKVGESICCDSCGHIQCHHSELSMLTQHKTAAKLEPNSKECMLPPLADDGLAGPKSAAPKQPRLPVPGLRGWVKCTGNQSLKAKADIIGERQMFATRLSELRVWGLLFWKLHGRRARVLDLFSGQGGAAHGLALNSFEVRSVDILEQPFHTNHPRVSFIQGDAMKQDLEWADVVWASPPCQSYSTLPKVADGKSDSKELKLIPAVREMCRRAGKPFIIENVMGARSDLESPIGLCGSMMGLEVIRHRLFECSFEVDHSLRCDHEGLCLGVCSRVQKLDKHKQKVFCCDGNVWAVYGSCGTVVM